MIPYRRMAVVLIAAMLVYVALGRAVFTIPVDLDAAEACGFTGADFAPSGRIEYAPTQAWWISFVRKEEYWSAVSLGLAAAFIALAVTSIRQLGRGIAAGAAVGGGAVAAMAVCLGCLAPALSIVGLGLGAAALAGIPKWLMALNALLITAWGTLFLSRRLASCPLSPASGNAMNTCQKGIAP